MVSPNATPKALVGSLIHDEEALFHPGPAVQPLQLGMVLGAPMGVNGSTEWNLGRTVWVEVYGTRRRNLAKKRRRWAGRVNHLFELEIAVLACSGCSPAAGRPAPPGASGPPRSRSGARGRVGVLSRPTEPANGRGLRSSAAGGLDHQDRSTPSVRPGSAARSSPGPRRSPKRPRDPLRSRRFRCSVGELRPCVRSGAKRRGSSPRRSAGRRSRRPRCSRSSRGTSLVAPQRLDARRTGRGRHRVRTR